MSTRAQAVDAADAHPLVAITARYANEVLAPAAVRTDTEGVSRGTIDDLRGIGLLHADPDRPAEVDLRLHEVLAEACFNTWLVWAQHAPQVRRLADLAAQGRAVSNLARSAIAGEVLLGAGVSDVRRYPHGHLVAERADAGWAFSGTISWVSGWGLIDAIGIDAVEAGSEAVISALVPLAGATSVHGHDLALAAVGGSRTARVRLDAVRVATDDISSTLRLDAWRERDLGVASDARAHHFGLARRVLGELDGSDDAARAVAAAWAPRVAAIRERAYALAQHAAKVADPRALLSERLATKAASADALGVLTRALVSARSGRSLATDDTAQLHARSALFVLVQGQTADVRATQLDRLAARATAEPFPGLPRPVSPLSPA